MQTAPSLALVESDIRHGMLTMAFDAPERFGVFVADGFETKTLNFGITVDGGLMRAAGTRWQLKTTYFSLTDEGAVPTSITAAQRPASAGMAERVITGGEYADEATIDDYVDPKVIPFDFTQQGPIFSKKPPKKKTYTFVAGQKIYELGNHLGNVLVTISDRKLQVEGTGGKVKYYLPDVLTMTDYYPFGSPLSGRTETQAGEKAYRYGTNGQEKNNEIYGEGNGYTAEFWQYDPRIARRWNLDPKPSISISPYATFFNSPIQYSDAKGDSSRIYGSQPGNYQVYTRRDDGNFYDMKGVQYVSGTDKFVDESIDNINKIVTSGDEGKRLIESISKSTKDIFIKEQSGIQAHQDGTVYMDFTMKSKVMDEKGYNPIDNWLILAHEMAHGEDYLMGNNQYAIWGQIGNTNVIEGEKYATHIENKIRAQNGMPLRTHYGTSIDPATGGVIGVFPIINGKGESLFFKVTVTTIYKSSSEYSDAVHNPPSTIQYPYNYRRDTNEKIENEKYTSY